MSERPFWDVPFLLYIYGGWGNKPLLHLTVFYRLGLMGKIARYSKMSGGPSVFRSDHGAAFYHPTSVYCVFPQTHTTVRISDSCPVSLPWASMQKYTACMALPSCRVGKNRSERRVEAHRGICRTWPDAEHIPLRPIFTRFPA